MTDESLFVAALDRSTPADRRAFLDEACAGDEALRRRLELLLAAHEATLGILDRTTRPTGWTEVAADLKHEGGPSGVRAGTVIAGRYKLLEEIGAGGMGSVWKAEQTQPVRRIVALKLIKAGMDSKTVLSRFEAERQALAIMEHPNIARVLDGGTTEAGRPFFVMEYVKGVPLTKYCDDARLSIDQRLALFVPVCQAVQHAHTKGVIHRDLKPSNILVCLFDGHPVPKVIDFGLAKATREPLTESTLHTAHGELLGTPLYMSPEQAEINNLDVDARSDIYALGVILYELLTGTTPLERRRFREAALHEMLRLIKEEEPPRPSARLGGSDSLPSLAAERRIEPLRLTRMVRGELDWIVMKALQKDRSRRYETADGFARDINRYLVDEPVEAGPPSTSYQLWKFVRRHRAVIALVAAAAVILVTATAVSTWQAVRATRAEAAAEKRRLAEVEQRRVAVEQRDRAVKAEAQARQSETEAKTVLEFFGDRVLAAARPEGQEGGLGREVTLRAALDAAEPEIAKGFAKLPRVEAVIRDTLGRSFGYLGETERAIRQLERARSLRLAELGREHLDTLESMNNLAVLYWEAGRIAESVTLHEETLRLKRATLGDDNPSTLRSMNDLALAYQEAGRFTDSIALLEEARKPFAGKLGPDHPDTLGSLVNLSVAYREVGRLEEALKLREETHRRLVAKLGYGHAETLSSMHNLASGYESDNKLDRAIPLFEEVVKLRKAKLGADNPSTLVSMNSLAFCYQNAGRLDQARELYEETLKLQKAKLGDDHFDTLISVHNLASCYRAAGKHDLVLPLMEENLRRARATLGPDHHFTLRAMNGLAKTYRIAGKMDPALPLFREAAAGFEKMQFRGEAAGRIVNDLIAALELSKRFDEAEEWRRKWLAVVKERDGGDSLPCADELGGLGVNLVQQQKWADAESVLREALALREKKEPGGWATHLFRSTLGRALLGRKQYVEAEPLLIRGYEQLKAVEAQVPAADRHLLAEGIEPIVQLYEAWGNPEKAAEWRAKLPRPEESAPKP